MGNEKRITSKPTLQQILDFYDVHLRETQDRVIAAALDIGLETLQKRIERYPEFKYAKELAEQRRGNRATFAGYVYGHLSPEAKKVWDELQFWDSSESCNEKIDYILSGTAKRIRQELFIHALIRSNFDLTAACNMVHVPRRLLTDWQQNDLEFRQLVEEIQWAKKDFFEQALVALVHEKHPSAIIFANRTYNADRGYSEKLQVSQRTEMVVTSFSIEDLAPWLDLDTKRKLLEAIRARKASLNVDEMKAIPHEV